MPVLMLPLASILGVSTSWLLAVLGIGLVIFVHELGHFLVAKKCGVRCEIFSLGFGPRLFGFRRGHTDYRISLVPIGGYVKMAGDNPGETLEGDEGELPSKSVLQRLAIFSAGVVMNLLFALVTLPVVLAVGVMFHSTVVGTVESGGPAWQAGLRPGDEIVRVGDHEVYDFSNVVAQIALSDPESLEIEFVRDGQTIRRVVRPQKDDGKGRYTIGIQPAAEDCYQIVEGGAAEAAGMTDADCVIAVDGKPVKHYTDLRDIIVANESPQVTLTVEDKENPGSTREVILRPRPSPETPRMIGVRAYVDQVKALRGEARKLAAGGDFVEPGDVLRSLHLYESDPQESQATTLPVRDPEEMEKAFEVASSASRNASLKVLREGVERFVRLPRGVSASVADDIALTQNLQSRFVRVRDGLSAQAAGMPDGCEIVKVRGVAIEEWQDLQEQVQESEGVIDVEVLVDGVSQTFSLQPAVESRLSDFGLVPVYAMVKRQYGILEAARVGVIEAGYMLKNVYLTLKKIFARDVSPKNLSGILTIVVVSKSLAESGVPSLFFFLAVLSLNLAFLNLLPIPVLDGGHILFLLVEKIKGSPVSEKVTGYSQLVGVVMVLALLLYVTYNDLLRIFSLS